MPPEFSENAYASDVINVSISTPESSKLANDIWYAFLVAFSIIPDVKPHCFQSPSKKNIIFYKNTVYHPILCLGRVVYSKMDK